MARYAYMKEYWKTHPKLRKRSYEKYKLWVQNNPEKYVAARLKFKGKTEELKDKIRNLKMTTPCMDCGQLYHYCVMDFDHRDRNTKVVSIAYLMRNTNNMALIEEEMAKCDLVCSNCHRLRTFKRKDWLNKDD
jgi:hypothetical protein